MLDEESVNYGAIHTNYSSRPGAGSQWFPRSQALIALISNTSSVETRGATLCGVGRVGIHSGGRGKVFGAAPAVTFSPKPRPSIATRSTSPSTVVQAPRTRLGKRHFDHHLRPHELPGSVPSCFPKRRTASSLAAQWPLPPTATVPFAVSSSGRHRSPSTFDAAATERASPSMPVASLSPARRLQATLPRRRRLPLQCCSTRPKP